MRRTDKRLSDPECRDVLEEIIKMVIDTYKKPLRDGFHSRMAQEGFDLTMIFMNRGMLVPGEEGEQRKIDLREAADGEKE